VAGVGTSTTAPADTAATATPSFAQQLGARLTNLTGLGPGRHVLSVPIDPEHLGPVRVVARIAGDQVRIELVGATDQVREALRESLGQLRRDLADAGMRAELGLGTQSGDGSQDAPESSGTEPGPPAPVAPAAASGITTTQRDLSAATAAAAHTGRIDILV
jgi:flagellar hook-length control protein FliK